MLRDADIFGDEQLHWHDFDAVVYVRVQWRSARAHGHFDGRREEGGEPIRLRPDQGLRPDAEMQRRLKKSWRLGTEHAPSVGRG